MSLVMSLALYFVIWWVVLFAVLPLGIRTQGESGTVVPGTPESAPDKPDFKRIVLLTTLVAAVVLAAVHLVIRFGLIPFERLGAPPA
jgi:predicted secreted protein